MRKFLVFLLIFLFSFSLQAQEAEIFYKGNNISNSLDIIRSDSGSLSREKVKINFKDLEKIGFNLNITKKDKNKTFEIKHSEKKIIIIFKADEVSTEYNFTEPDSVYYSDSNKRIYPFEGEEFKDSEKQVSLMELNGNLEFKKRDNTTALFVPIVDVLSVFDFDLIADKSKYMVDSNFKKLEIYQPTTFDLWKAEEEKNLNNKRQEKFDKIKSKYNFMNQKTLTEVKNKIFDDDKMIDRVLDYLEGNEVSKKTTERLFKGKIWFGMTRDQLRAVKGDPKKINSTQTEYYIHEQWVYSVLNHEYYYFENGELTTAQN